VLWPRRRERLEDLARRSAGPRPRHPLFRSGCRGDCEANSTPSSRSAAAGERNHLFADQQKDGCAGDHGLSRDRPCQRSRRAHVNIEALTRLTMRSRRQLIREGNGAQILNISSIASLLPLCSRWPCLRPRKSYGLKLHEALRCEIARSGVASNHGSVPARRYGANFRHADRPGRRDRARADFSSCRRDEGGARCLRAVRDDPRGIIPGGRVFCVMKHRHARPDVSAALCPETGARALIQGGH